MTPRPNPRATAILLAAVVGLAAAAPLQAHAADARSVAAPPPSPDYVARAHARLGLLIRDPSGTVRMFAISATYASYGDRRPEVLIWARAASQTARTMASSLALSQAMQLVADHETAGGVRAIPQVADGVRMRELLAAGNLAVYSDLGPVHEAYLDGGIDAVARVPGIRPAVVDAFRTIDAGAVALAAARRSGDPAAIATAKRQILDGNLALLYDEQRSVVQPVVFDKDPALWQRNAWFMRNALNVLVADEVEIPPSGNPADLKTRMPMADAFLASKQAESDELAIDEPQVMPDSSEQRLPFLPPGGPGGGASPMPAGRLGGVDLSQVTLRHLVLPARGSTGTVAYAMHAPRGRADVDLDDATASASRWDPLESTCRHASLSIL